MIWYDIQRIKISLKPYAAVIEFLFNDNDAKNLDDEKSTERTKKLNLEPTPELIVGLVLDDLIKQISEKSLDPGKHSFFYLIYVRESFKHSFIVTPVDWNSHKGPGSR